MTVVTALLTIPAAAFAYFPVGDDFITCVTGGGNALECVAGIFEEGCPADITVTDEAGTVIDTATGTADADGEVVFDLTVPPGQADGDLTVRVECGPKVLVDTIAAIEDGEVIAVTGFDALSLLGVGVGALALGAGVLAVARRSRRTTSA